MDHHSGNSVGVLGITATINLIAILDRGAITFILSVCVSVLAGIYYVLNIRKLKREERLQNKNLNNKKQ